MRASLILAVMMVAAPSALAGVLQCKVEGYRNDVFITTSPDTNQNDGHYARIGVSRGIGDRAIVIVDRTGAQTFIELNIDDTPIGLWTLQKDMRLVVSNHSIDPSGGVFAPSQYTGVCTRLR
ncbi:hypothetical protein JNB88_23600 [Rhizobium cauense]|uniref:hypothetical protein n=1 Tax=Rhizobium cauense TaxID=1166683 RepID=UPI001C6EBF85|nr:hypothetical protein [Rhizobium cauense]MBW9116622.1 hypothetical protein [Rhizobium cauense]